MKAMLFNEFGPPEVLHYEDRPDPEPGAKDLRHLAGPANTPRILLNSPKISST